VALGAVPIAVDPSPAARARAVALGALDEVPSEVDVSIDAVGSAATADAAVRSLRRRGRHVQVGLMLDDYATPQIPMAQVISHELEIYGSHGMQAWRYDAMLSMVTTGKIAPQKLIGRRIALEEAIPGLMTLDRAEGVGISVITQF